MAFPGGLIFHLNSISGEEEMVCPKASHILRANLPSQLEKQTNEDGISVSFFLFCRPDGRSTSREGEEVVRY